MTASLTGKTRLEKWESFMEYYHELDAAGRDLDEIAEFFGVTRSWMLRKLRNAGIDGRKHHKPGVVAVAAKGRVEFLAQFHALRGAGLDMYAIADELGTSRANLMCRLKKAGIDTTEYKLPTGTRRGTGKWKQRYTELKEQGLDNHQIAKAMGIKYESVMSITLSMGLREKLPRGGPAGSRK